MTWVKLDDGFYDNPKVKRAGLQAIGLYAMALSYCGRHLTDGFVDAEFVKAHGNKNAVERLVTVGLWEETGEGWRIRDYLQFNFSREQIETKRARDLERKKARSEKNPDGIRDDSEKNPTRLRAESSTRAGARARAPVPSPSTTTPSSAGDGTDRSEETGAAAPATPNGAAPLIDRMTNLVHTFWDEYPDKQVLADELRDRGLTHEQADQIIHAEQAARA